MKVDTAEAEEEGMASILRSSVMGVFSGPVRNDSEGESWDHSDVPRDSWVGGSKVSATISVFFWEV